ncbi:MAG: helix-turn-helix domain-containing protein [Candidatus Limnocylindrales bacterium]
MSAATILRYARRHAGLSQRELARRTGIAQPAIARIERGSVSPRLDTLERLLAGAGQVLEPEPLLGVGVDRTLIQGSLAQTPEARIRSAAAAWRGLSSFLRATGHGSRS